MLSPCPADERLVGEDRKFLLVRDFRRRRPVSGSGAGLLDGPAEHAPVRVDDERGGDRGGPLRHESGGLDEGRVVVALTSKLSNVFSSVRDVGAK
jgi:hypothetical protein